VTEIRVGFIGAGNMASSIITGLLDRGLPPGNIRASDPSDESLARLKAAGPIFTSRDNRDVVSEVDVVILAVKPQVMLDALSSVRDQLSAQGCIVISIAAGITLGSLESQLGSATPIVRCMPNTPALLQQGASALFANTATEPAQRQVAQAVMGAVGTVCWLESEAQMDAVTALSGSGPAYFFLLLEAMVDAGEQLGLDRATATALAVQTGVGATRMAALSEADLAELRRRVTSPGGTTEAAIQSFEAADLRGIVQRALSAAAERSRELARELG
jgi:pyrroline-5-carboxylate reductase